MSNQHEALRLAEQLEDTESARLHLLPYAAAELRRLHAELERRKTMPMRYRRMEFNAQLQTENERLTIERDEARRTAREAHEMGTQVVAQRERLLEALRWIASVNATDREYQAKARAAIAAVGGEKS